MRAVYFDTTPTQTTCPYCMSKIIFKKMEEQTHCKCKTIQVDIEPDCYVVRYGKATEYIYK